jgi:hypothetical protein
LNAKPALDVTVLGGYFPAMKITTAAALPEYRLKLQFYNGEEGVVDLSALVRKGFFSAWREPDLFDRVRVTDRGAVEWPGEIDLCPDALYLRMTGKTPEEIFPAVRNHLAQT